jgi:hypothetical protein
MEPLSHHHVEGSTGLHVKGKVLLLSRCGFQCSNGRRLQQSTTKKQNTKKILPSSRFSVAGSTCLQVRYSGPAHPLNSNQVSFPMQTKLMHSPIDFAEFCKKIGCAGWRSFNIVELIRRNQLKKKLVKKDRALKDLAKST